MSTIRIESLGPDQEVVDYIDLRDDTVNAERIDRARQILRARRAYELGDIGLADTLELDLVVEEL